MNTFSNFATHLRDVHARGRDALTHLPFLHRELPRVYLLMLDGRSVADLVLLDLRHPAFALVFPGAAYGDIEPTFRDWGDHLWKSEFAPDGTSLQLEARAREICTRLSIATLDGRPLPGVAVDLFDSTFDRPTCPFALLDLRSAPALVAAELQPSPNFGSAAAVGTPPPARP